MKVKLASITSDSRCVLCGSEGEIGVHILCNCAFAACVWSFSVLGRLSSGNSPPTVGKRVISLIPMLDKHRFDLILMLSYAIWTTWNSIFGLANVIFLMSWSLALSLGGKIFSSSLLLLLPLAASRPLRGLGLLKLNIDGVWNANRLIGGMGAVFRDSAIIFLAGLSKSLSHVPSPLFVEALSIREGLALASSRGFQNIIIERNHPTFYSLSLDLSPINLIVEDSREISSRITGVCFTHIRRQANKVAHRLARYSLLSTSPGLWFKEPPDFILDVLLEDCLLEL
ncbi:hypothetical protein DVH24_002550 [Malus domestica]|uniref:RNase H type-1 domain-containing protein n=1 Tax=Malus domestica TaxID=3750 RepID=A0A498IU68_MALDO|nr:hypothetical protein DVH24_002550 [Malus domestica]